MNPQDFQKWKEVFSKNRIAVSHIWIRGEKFDENLSIRNWWLDGADAAYNLLSKEISEKDEFIEKLKLDIYDLYDEKHNRDEEINKLKNDYKVLRSALRDIKNFDDELEEKWGDPGERAKAALDKTTNQL